jgi:lambda repressor-like predicted transcriptional regulator
MSTQEVRPEAIAYAHRLHQKGFTLAELARTLNISVAQLRAEFEQLEKNQADD